MKHLSVSFSGFVFALLVTVINSASWAAVLSVESYGGRADGSLDSTWAFQTAIKAAIQSGTPTTIALAAGTYRLDCKGGGFCLNVQGAHGLTIKGQGANQTQILLNNPVAGLINVSGSSDISISGFSVDYSSLPFSQGRISAVYPGSNSIDIVVESGYPGLDQAIFSPANLALTFGMLFHSQSPVLKDDASNAFFVKAISKSPNGSFHVSLTELANIAVNDQFALPNRSQTGIYFYQTRNITLKQVTLYTGPGAASIWVQNSGTIVIDGFEVRRKPGTTRLLSTAADAIHMYENAGTLVIQNCYIEGMGDDAINTRSGANSVTASSSSSFSFYGASSAGLAFGQTLQIVDPKSQLPKGIGKIVSLQIQSGTAYVVLDRVIPGLATGDLMFNTDLASPNALITNNTFSNFRGIFRIRSKGALFLNNTILDPRNAIVLTSADIQTAWQEGPSLLSTLSGVFFNGNTVNGGSLNLVGVNYAFLGAPPLSGGRALLAHPLVYNPQFYQAANPDLANLSQADLLAHWINHGISEGRIANLGFKASEYLQNYPDLSAAYGRTNYQQAIFHYIYYGAILEKRVGFVAGSALVYDGPIYKALNPDLAGFFDGTLDAHWYLHGIDEGRQASSNFSAGNYLSRYADLRSAFGATNYRAAGYHYVLYGYSEGRIGK